MKLPKGYLSPSQIQRYMSCPACYYQEYVKGRERPVSVALPIGGAVHRGIEFARRRQLAGRPWELDEVTAVGVDHFDGADDAIDLGKFPDRGAAKDEVARLLEYVTPRLLELDVQRGGLTAVEVWVCSDPHLLTEAEQRHQHLPYAEVARAFPVPVKGRLDAIYGDRNRRVIEDLKTASRAGRPQGAGFQLGFYLMPWLNTPRSASGLIDVLVKTKEPTLDHYALNEVNPQTMRDIILDVADSISEGYFPPRPGMYCDYDHGFPTLSVAIDGYREAA